MQAEQALVPQGEDQYVFRIIDGKAVRTKVAVGQRRDGKVEVTSGVAAGDLVVSAGQLKLRDGVPVAIAGNASMPDCTSYSGRSFAYAVSILYDDDPLKGKYVNSPETPIFTKGKVFFGLDKSKRAISKAHLAVVCEGQLDLISAFEAGVQNVTAPQGTAFTAQQARLLDALWPLLKPGVGARILVLQNLEAELLRERAQITQAAYADQVKRFPNDRFDDELDKLLVYARLRGPYLVQEAQKELDRMAGRDAARK